MVLGQECFLDFYVAATEIKGDSQHYKKKKTKNQEKKNVGQRPYMACKAFR
jgi:hypothetical protein